jgi:hypothetical protein
VIKMNLTDPAVLLVAGVVCLALGFGAFELGLARKTKGFFKLIGVAMTGYAVLSLAGFSLVGQEQAPPASVAGDFTVTAAESMSHLTVDNNANTFTWAVTYNYTSSSFASGTQYFQAVFSISRGIGTVGLVQVSGDVYTVPTVFNTTTGQDIALLTKTGDQYNALWTRFDGTTAYNLITLTIPENSDGTTVTLNMTLNSGAIGSMLLYDTQTINLQVGGELWAVQVLLAVAT